MSYFYASKQGYNRAGGKFDGDLDPMAAGAAVQAFGQLQTVR